MQFNINIEDKYVMYLPEFEEFAENTEGLEVLRVEERKPEIIYFVDAKDTQAVLNLGKLLGLIHMWEYNRENNRIVDRVIKIFEGSIDMTERLTTGNLAHSKANILGHMRGGIEYYNKHIKTN